MDKKIKGISPACRRRLSVQGYKNYSDSELNDYKFGIRFAYGVCAAFVALGLVLGNITLLIIAAVIAFIGMFPPYHPVDYLYNYAIRHLLHKPKLPHRTAQGRFACRIATPWLIITIYLFYNGFTVAGYVFGGTLLAIATLVSTTDFCIPSIIYNALFREGKDEVAPS